MPDASAGFKRQVAYRTRTFHFVAAGPVAYKPFALPLVYDMTRSKVITTMNVRSVCLLVRWFYPKVICKMENIKYLYQNIPHTATFYRIQLVVGVF